MNNFLIVIPAYNEATTVSKVIKNVKEARYPFVVVDDGSTDKTLDSIFKETNYCIGYAENRGKGYAIKLGAEYAFANDYDWIITLDSDGQMSVNDIEQFKTAIKKYPEASIILGNRLHNPEGMSLLRKITNYVMSYIISKLAKTNIIDSQCGMRAIHKQVFRNDFKSNNFELESEMLIKIGQLYEKIINVPIKCIYHKNRQSKMHPVKDLVRFIKMIFNLRNCYKR